MEFLKEQDPVSRAETVMESVKAFRQSLYLIFGAYKTLRFT